MRLAINDKLGKKEQYEGVAANFKEIQYFPGQHKI